MAQARKNLDWNTQMDQAMDTEKARDLRGAVNQSEEGCSMCGKYCAIRLIKEYLREDTKTASQ